MVEPAMAAEPVLVIVRRWLCPFCRRGRSSKRATTAHVGRCWLNPAVRSCKTCASFDEGGDACGCEPGCNWGSPSGPIPPSCGAGIELATVPMTGCPLWTAVAGDTESAVRAQAGEG